MNLFCLHYPDRHPHKNKIIQGPVGQQKPQSQFVTKLPLDYKTTLNYKTSSGKKQTLKEAKYNTARYENPKPLCGKKGTYIPAC